MRNFSLASSIIHYEATEAIIGLNGTYGTYDNWFWVIHYFPSKILKKLAPLALQYCDQGPC